jgi:hypothetical protein
MIPPNDAEVKERELSSFLGRPWLDSLVPSTGRTWYENGMSYLETEQQRMLCNRGCSANREITLNFVAQHSLGLPKSYKTT